MSVNEILLRRKHKLNIAKNDYVANKTEKVLMITILKNIEAYGFTFSEDVFNTLLTFTKSELESFYLDLIPKLKKLVGADKQYTPMYPNFPQQVMEASDVELIVNAIIHYFTLGEWTPKYEKDERLPLIDDNKMIVLSLGTTDDIMSIFNNLVSSKTSLSEQDKNDIKDIVKQYPECYKYLPSEIPLKENVALIGKIIIEETPIKSVYYLEKYFKTATDVLRLITALSDGDISLATKTEYRKLRRWERRMIMQLLANCHDIVEDFFRYKYQWIRIGEIIHPFEYKKSKYMNVNNAFNYIRNDTKPVMFARKVHDAIVLKDMNTAAELLKGRPGEFARQLDKVLRDAENKNYVINCFKDVAENVSTPVLLQVRQHFIGRNLENPVRVFFPKGNLATNMVVPNNLPIIEEKYCKAVIKICEAALIKNYQSREFLGKIYIDEELKNYIVPFSQRSASSANKTIVRGSNIPIKENAEAIRAFIWWTNTYDERVDIDLSAAIYDEDWNYIEHISYTNLRSVKLEAYHSGDITDGGWIDGIGASEFLDVDIDSVANNGRYIVYQIYNYTGQNFSEMPNCRFGWMKREEVNSGEIFEPTTVKMMFDVTSKSTVVIPVIFDCKERKFIWCDMNLHIKSVGTRRYIANNIENNLSGVTATCYAMTHLNKANIYDLIMLNAKARGIIVDDRNDADIIFSNDITQPTNAEHIDDNKENIEIITAYDVDYFMGQLL